MAGNRTALWKKFQETIGRSVPSETMMVWCKMFFLNFYNIDEHQGTIWADMIFIRIWEDPRTNLGCAHPSLYLSSSQAKELWMPEASMITLDVADNGAPNPTDVAGITMGGWVANAKKLLFRSACRMDFTYFPFDKMSCDFTASPATVPNGYTNISWANEKPCSLVVTEMNLGSHLFEKFELVREIAPDGLGMGSGSLEYITCRMHFNRHHIHYWFQMYIPNTLTVMVAWISFFIMPDAAPARVTLGISSLIAMVLQYGNTIASLPKVSYLKGIDVWMLSCVVFIFSVLLEYAYLCSIKRRPNKIAFEGCEESCKKITKIDNIAKWVYPLAFLAFGAIYFLIHMIHYKSMQ